MTPPIALMAMIRIVEYCEQQGWIPVGRRTFTVGEWEIVINGSSVTWELIPPFSASVSNARYVGMMIVDAHGGNVAGWNGTEDEFIAAMDEALAVKEGAR